MQINSSSNYNPRHTHSSNPASVPSSGTTQLSLPPTTMRPSPSTSSTSPAADINSPSAPLPDGRLRAGDQWLFSEKDLYRTPSAACGIRWEEEKELRKKGVAFLQQVAWSLKLPQIAIATAAVFFHRFYMRRSLKDYHHYNVAATCLFLAAKVEETVRKLKDVAHCCIQKANRRVQSRSNAEYEKDHCRWRENILFHEQLLLENITFDLTLDHPYQTLMEMTVRLSLRRTLVHQAWTVLNDSLRTVVCLRYTAPVIAAAALYLASRLYGEKIVARANNDSNPFPTSQNPLKVPREPPADEWWRYWGVELHEMQEAAAFLLGSYWKNDSLGIARQQNSSSSPSQKAASGNQEPVSNPTHQSNGKKRFAESVAEDGVNERAKKQQITLAEYRNRNAAAVRQQGTSAIATSEKATSRPTVAQKDEGNGVVTAKVDEKQGPVSTNGPTGASPRSATHSTLSSTKNQLPSSGTNSASVDRTPTSRRKSPTPARVHRPESPPPPPASHHQGSRHVPRSQSHGENGLDTGSRVHPRSDDIHDVRARDERERTKRSPRQGPGHRKGGSDFTHPRPHVRAHHPHHDFGSHRGPGRGGHDRRSSVGSLNGHDVYFPPHHYRHRDSTGPAPGGSRGRDRGVQCDGRPEDGSKSHMQGRDPVTTLSRKRGNEGEHQDHPPPHPYSSLPPRKRGRVVESGRRPSSPPSGEKGKSDCHGDRVPADEEQEDGEVR